MPSTDDLRLAAKALEEDDVLDLGERSAQANGSSVYGVYPQPFAEDNGLEQGSRLRVGYHPPTKAVVLVPADDEDSNQGEVNEFDSQATVPSP